MAQQGVVLNSIVNLHSRPGDTADLVTQATLGMPVHIEEEEAGWYHVRLPDRYRGWLKARGVKIYAPGETPYPASEQVALIQNLLAFLYYEPQGTYRLPAMQVPIGVRLAFTDRVEGWVQVRLPDGARYWIRQGDVQIVAADYTPPRGSVAEVLATARRFLGLPYLWGGTTPLGIDCSGFVQLVYRLNGVFLLRDARLQYDQPELPPVPQEALQAGDLLFFGQQPIAHVGLYLGDGEFIHATTYRRPIVQISRLDEPYWTGLYRGARRP